MSMEPVRRTSPDLTADNVRRLAELFPSVITETRDDAGDVCLAVDFDLLRQELSDHVVEGPQERYQLDWPGKRAAAFAANVPTTATLRPDREESVDFDTTKNVFIEGDNLEVLKVLQESYLGKVKMIYIDPPYNTGNDFVYDDDFAASKEEYLARSGGVDDDGARLRSNPESNGRFHSDWLSMMYPRLKLARNLLERDGAIFASIDDHELDSLIRLMSEVFGESNFIGTMVWAAGRKNDSRFISSSHEYIVCFARDKAHLRQEGINWKTEKPGLDEIYAQVERLQAQHDDDYAAASAALRQWFTALPGDAPAKRHKHYNRIDERGVYFADNISWPGGGGPTYEVLHPITGQPVRKPSRGWLFQEPALKKQIALGKVDFGLDHTSVPTFKRYLAETSTEVPYSVFYQDGRAASKRLRTLMDGMVFDFPKDETVLRSLVEMTTGPGDVILDFFAGSGTTAHAVMLQNAQDGGNRRFALVQLPETPAEKSEAARQGYPTISAVTRERLRRAGRAVIKSSDAEGLDVGFRAYRLDASPFTEKAFTAENTTPDLLAELENPVRPDRTPEDLLTHVLLAWGLDLSVDIQTVSLAGQAVFDVEDGALLAAFSGEVTDKLAEVVARREPARAVFLDSGFVSDAARINMEQIFREISPSTDVKVL